MTVTPIRPGILEHPDGAHSLDVAIRADISYRMLDHWTRTGRLHPIEDAPGSGNPRRYPPTEVAVAVLMGRLVRAGLQVKPAERHARELLQHGTTLIAGIRIHLPEQL